MAGRSDSRQAFAWLNTAADAVLFVPAGAGVCGAVSFQCSSERRNQFTIPMYAATIPNAATVTMRGPIILDAGFLVLMRGDFANLAKSSPFVGVGYDSIETEAALSRASFWPASTR